MRWRAVAAKRLRTWLHCWRDQRRQRKIYKEVFSWHTYLGGWDRLDVKASISPGGERRSRKLYIIFPEALQTILQHERGKGRSGTSRQLVGDKRQHGTASGRATWCLVRDLLWRKKGEPQGNDLSAVGISLVEIIPRFEGNMPGICSANCTSLINRWRRMGGLYTTRPLKTLRSAWKCRATRSSYWCRNSVWKPHGRRRLQPAHVTPTEQVWIEWTRQDGKFI